MRTHQGLLLWTAILTSALFIFVVGCGTEREKVFTPLPHTAVKTNADDAVTPSRVKAERGAGVEIERSDSKTTTRTEEDQAGAGFLDKEPGMDRAIENTRWVDSHRQVDNSIGAKH